MESIEQTKRILITGGSGFIGTSLIRHLCKSACNKILNIDCLTYASSPDSLNEVSNQENYQHRQHDIRNLSEVTSALQEFEPDLVLHLAAESHVDRSIDSGEDFISTNIVGTYNMLEASLIHWRRLSTDRKSQFRFHHISTDEVYGSLGATGYFSEESPYAPSSPYSASKASSDHLVRAWNRTYGLPTLITNCSNNYGPFQFPEKLIPVVILNALDRKPLPIYGSGDNIRDWIFVDDHIEALWSVATGGSPGSTYNIGGNQEYTNLEVVKTICDILDSIKPHEDGCYSELIEFVSDRPGHDKRYAIDASKIKREIGWQPKIDFQTGIFRTIEWYLANEWWWRPIRDNGYAQERLGADKSA